KRINPGCRVGIVADCLLRKRKRREPLAPFSDSPGESDHSQFRPRTRPRRIQFRVPQPCGTLAGTPAFEAHPRTLLSQSGQLTVAEPQMTGASAEPALPANPPPVV